MQRAIERVNLLSHVMKAARSRPVLHCVLWDDSNFGFGGGGRSKGWNEFFKSALPNLMYSSPMASAAENGGQGQDLGVDFTINNSGYTSPWSMSGAPAALDVLMRRPTTGIPFTDNGHAKNYWHRPAGGGVDAGRITGIGLGAGTGLDINSTMLRFNLLYGVPAGSGGSFRPCILHPFDGVNSVNLYSGKPTISFGAPTADEVRRFEAVLSLTPGGGTRVTGRKVDFWLNHPYDGVDAVGPFTPLYLWADRPDRVAGWCWCYVDNRGGESNYGGLRRMIDWSRADYAAMAFYFGERRRQHAERGFKPLIVVYLFGGGNDLLAAGSPPGPSGGEGGKSYVTGKYDNDSPAGVLENWQAQWDFFEKFWVAQGWDLSELVAVHCPFHVHQDFGAAPTPESKLIPMRQAIREWVKTKRGHVFIDAAEVMTRAEFEGKGFYDSGGNPYPHMVDAGHKEFATRTLGAALAMTGPADAAALEAARA